MRGIFYVLFFAFSSCTYAQTIKAKYDDCIEHSEKIEFTTDDGRKGFSHNVTQVCVIGANLPEFVMSDIKGLKMNSNELKGRISVIHFWFIKCKPCLEEMPKLDAFSKQFNNSNIDFFAISTDSKSEIQKFLETHTFGFRHFADGQVIIDKYFGATWGFPSTWVFDEENKVIRIFGKLQPEDFSELEFLLQ